ncbi:MAG: ion channel [Desulfurococcales archaeon]|nr:ion channel [Desulfurococcales archaeon]
MVVSIIYRTIRRMRRSLAVDERSRLLFTIALWIVLWITSAILFYYTETVKGGGELTVGDTLYWALITMATVGYGDITPSTGPGRLVAGLTSVFGIAVYTLAISLLADTFLNLTMRRLLGLARLGKKQILVIGSSEICKHAIDELLKNNLEESIGWLTVEQPKIPPEVDFMVGDISEESLEKAGVKRAEHVILCLDDDSKTIHTALLVRKLNRNARITAHTESSKTAEMLRDLGLAKAIPKSIIGRLLASSVFEPDVPDVISELASIEGELDLAEEEMEEDKEVSEIEEERGTKILAVIKKNGARIYTPGPRMVVEKGDKIVLTKKTRTNG